MPEDKTKYFIVSDTLSSECSYILAMEVKGITTVVIEKRKKCITTYQKLIFCQEIRDLAYYFGAEIDSI